MSCRPTSICGTLPPQPPGHPPEANLEFPGQEEEPHPHWRRECGISGHSSAQWPSHFLKGTLGWTLWVPEAQVGAPGPTAHSPTRAPAAFQHSPPHSLCFQRADGLFVVVVFGVLLCYFPLRKRTQGLYREKMALLRTVTDVGILVNLSLLGPNFLPEMPLSERSVEPAQCLLHPTWKDA